MVKWILAFASATALILSGWVLMPEEALEWASVPAGGPSEAQVWEPGHWWGYAATFASNRTYRLALVVSETHPDHFVVGSNLSAGFFGLPFDGNVTRPNLNPVIAGEEWRLFDFPLEAGKRWSYTFMGYTVNAEARPETIRIPGVPEHEGYRIEARAYGRLVTSYAYSPIAGWVSALDLFEPTNGKRLLHVELETFGAEYAHEYFVETPVFVHDQSFPCAAVRRSFELVETPIRYTGLLVIKAKAGVFKAHLVSPDGRTPLSVEATGQGVQMVRKPLPLSPGEWRVEHTGLGLGDLHVEILALRAARGTATNPATLPESETAPLDLARLFAPPVAPGDAAGVARLLESI